jgi:membrane associated rhomboid family serine protease
MIKKSISFLSLAISFREMAEAYQINIGRWTTLLIIICILLYLFPIIDISVGAFNLDLLPSEPWRIITSIFLHASFPHLFYNMVAFFIFGNLVEIHYGSRFFLLIVLLSGISGNLLFGLFEPSTSSVGISGVIFGLIGVAVVLLPNSKALMPLGIISVPAKVKIAGPIMALGEFIMGFFPSDIGHQAHFGGFFAGVILAFYIKKTGIVRNRMQEEDFHLEEVEL